MGDGGQAFGAAGPVQGDTRFGDIRVGGVPMGGDALAATVPPDPFVSGSLAGAAFRSGFALSLRRFKELLLIFRQALRFPEFDHRSNFFFRDKRSMQPVNARGT